MDVARGLIAVLKTAAGALRAADIPYCLAGGLAVSMLARPRATEDVDLIVAVDNWELAHLEQVLRQAFEVVQVSPLRRFARASIWRFLVTAAGLPGRLAVLDLILADRDEYRQAIAHAVTIDLDNTPIAVIDAERLIAVKRLAGRPIDLLDIESLRDSLDND
jgi:hypothetical protein